jgi:hypothetical protein
VLLDPARAFKPKDKPRIEAVQAYIRASLFGGRDFPSLAAMVIEAERWCVEVAGRRTPRALEGRTPLQCFAADEAGVLTPLPLMPFELARWSRPKLGPDAHLLTELLASSGPGRTTRRRACADRHRSDRDVLFQPSLWLMTSTESA